jgi:hypothetical protein
MTDLKQPDLMKALTAECIIFTVIVCCTTLLLNIRYHDRVIDQARGLVFYSPDVEKTYAVRLSNKLTSIGVFDGVPRVIRLENPDGTHQIKVAVAPETLASTVTQELLTAVFQGVCAEVFPDKDAEVWLIDEQLAPRLLLFTHAGRQATNGPSSTETQS